jgi:oxaloacetate decarboxylase alpha subunit
MISNLVSQLKEQKAEERLREVLDEIPRVRAEVGYPPLVTPMSQIVGTQAVINVLTGKRWQVVPDEMKAYFRGKYGKPPGPINPDLRKRVLGNDDPITVRPADLLTETVEEYRIEIGPLARSEEDVLSYALFPNAARGYFERRHRGAEQDVFMTGPATEGADAPAPVSTDRVRELVALVEAANVDEISVEDGGTKITVRKSGAARPLVDAVAPPAGGGAASPTAGAVAPAAPEAAAVASAAAAQSNGGFRVVAPMVGTFYASPSPGAPPFVTVGQRVNEGDVLCILEAMKLMNEVASEVTGVVRAVLVPDGSAVEYGQPLFTVDLDQA